MINLNLMNEVQNFTELGWQAVSRYHHDQVFRKLVDFHENLWEVYAIKGNHTAINSNLL
jgi:hypothetical protein